MCLVPGLGASAMSLALVAAARAIGVNARRAAAVSAADLLRAE